MSVISVGLSRAELVALKETIEVTPRFDGRTEVRDAVQQTLHERRTRPAPLSVEESALSELARRIIPIDVPSAAIRSKLNRALRGSSVT
jgi:hypothetical protein